MNLNETTRAQLDELVSQGVRISVIARRSGINYRWLERYRRGAIENPGVYQVQTLYDWLQLNRKGKRAGPLSELLKLSMGKGGYVKQA